MRGSILSYSSTYLYVNNAQIYPVASKADAQTKSRLFENGFNDLGVNRDDEATARPDFRKNFLGDFIPHTRADLLTLARVPEKKQDDPFLQHLAKDYWKQNKSVTNAHLALYRHIPKTLDIAQAPSIQEVDSFALVGNEDKVIGRLREAGDKLDQLFKDHLYNKNNVSLDRRNQDFALYLEGKEHITNLHTAYLRGQEKGNGLSDEARKQAFAEGRASTYKHELSTDRVIEILDDTASEEGEQAESASAASSSSANVPSDSQQISVITFKEAIENLKNFTNEEKNKKIKLDEITEKNIFRDFNTLATETGGSEWSIRVALAIGGAAVAALAGSAYFILKCWQFSEKRQLGFQNAFRKTLKEDLEQALNLLVSEVDMDPRGVNNNGQNTATPNTYIEEVVYGAAGELSGHLGNHTEAINKLTNAIEENQTKNEIRIARLERLAAEKLLSNNSSRSSFDSGYSSASSPLLVAGSERLPAQTLRSRSSSPTENMRTGQQLRAQSNSPEIRELKEAFEKVSEENKELKKMIVEDREIAKQEREEAKAREERLAEQAKKDKEEMFARMAGLFATQQQKPQD